MKHFVMLMLLLAAVGFVVSCGNDVTEVAWKNSESGSIKVNQIVWAQDNVEWLDTSSGITPGTQTAAKEVNSTESTVEISTCSTCDGSDFNAAQVTEITGAEYFSGSSTTPSVRVSDGSSNVLTFKAQ